MWPLIGALACVIFGIGAPLTLLVLALRLPVAEAQAANWRQAAKKRRAAIEMRGWLRSFPRLRFDYRGARVFVEIREAGGRTTTRVTLVGGRSPAAPKLGPVADARLAELRRAVAPAAVQLRLNGRLLELDVDAPLWAAGPLDALLQTSLAIHDQLLLADVDGIRFTDDDEVRPLEQVGCNICGDPIEQDLVYCPRCKTPHHQECWEYNGRCSTYGCGAVDYTTPESTP